MLYNFTSQYLIKNTLSFLNVLSSRFAKTKNQKPLNQKKYAIFKHFSSLLVLVSFSFYSNSSLVATSLGNIEGTAPYLILPDGVTKLTNLDELLGFSIWDGSYESDGTTKHRVQIIASQSDNPISAPLGLKFNDVVTLITADGTLKNIESVSIGDLDNDADLANSSTVVGQMKATWYKDNVAIPSINLSDELQACDGSVYSLKIEIPTEVRAETTFGLPNYNSYGTHDGVTYRFSSTGLCYLQPLDMKVYTGTAADMKYPNGYNNEKWVENKGFKKSAGFPTTGFQNASFYVKGAGSDQRKYRCTSSDHGSKLILSGNASTTVGKNCKITYNSLTRQDFTLGGTTPTIKLEYNSEGDTWIEVDNYKIPMPDKWAILKGVKEYADTVYTLEATAFPALDVCRGATTPITTWNEAFSLNPVDQKVRQTYMYRRNELTNAPQADLTEGNLKSGGRFSRDVDGTFMGEWGHLQYIKGISEGYPDSGWNASDVYWTTDVYSSEYTPWKNEHAFVHKWGYVDKRTPNGKYGLACRG